MGVRSPHVLPPFSSQLQQEHSPETAKSSLAVHISESFMFKKGFPLDLDRTCLDGRRVFLKILIEEGISYGS
jgi:hypothetical protein